MDTWRLLGLGAVAFVGALAFLRIVSNEVAVRNRLLAWRAKELEEERLGAEKRAAEAAALQAQAQGKEADITVVNKATG